MTPCGMNQVTPAMIRKGQMTVGDKIIFEEAAEAAAGSVETSVQAAKAVEAAEAAVLEAGGSVGAFPKATEHPEIPASASGAAGSVETFAKAAEAPETVEAAAGTTGEPAVVPAAAAENETAAATAAGATAARAAASVPGTDALSYGEGMVTKNPANLQGYQSAGLPPSWPNTAGQVAYPNEDRNQISYGRMTDYFQGAINGEGTSSSPTFTVPSNPMTPPEYTQTLDYDSIQYMNGFLRTQIGRFIRFEQLVGTNIVEDRSGFLVGVSNNYVILQEIGTGNIMTFDTFSIKFVYIYYEDFGVSKGSTSAY